MASQRTAEVSPYFVGPVYAIGLLFVVMPIVDTLAQVWPPAIGSPTWRYGTVGLGANYLISVLFGILLMCLAASLQRHRRTLRWLAGVNAAIGLVALVATLGFILDALQVRSGIQSANAQALRMFNTGVEKAVFKYLVSAVVLLWLGYSSWRAAKAMPHHREDADVPKLIHEHKAAE